MDIIKYYIKIVNAFIFIDRNCTFIYNCSISYYGGLPCNTF